MELISATDALRFEIFRKRGVLKCREDGHIKQRGEQARISRYTSSGQAHYSDACSRLQILSSS